MGSLVNRVPVFLSGKPSHSEGAVVGGTRPPAMSKPWCLHGAPAPSCSSHLLTLECPVRIGLSLTSPSYPYRPAHCQSSEMEGQGWVTRAPPCPYTGPGGQAGGPGVQSQVCGLHRSLLPAQGRLQGCDPRDPERIPSGMTAGPLPARPLGSGQTSLGSSFQRGNCDSRGQFHTRWGKLGWCVGLSSKDTMNFG